MKVTGWTYWDNPDYIDLMDAELSADDFEEMRQCVINEIRDKHLYFTGTSHQQYELAVPIIDDKYLFQVSMRSWGWIMADAYPNEKWFDGLNEHNRHVAWAWIVPKEVNQEKFIDKIRVVRTKEDLEEIMNEPDRC